jgi:hypothetical protein
MIRPCLVVMSFAVVSLAQAELLLCAEMKLCSLVCRSERSSVHTELVYANDGVSVDRVRVEAFGSNSLLYTFERVDKTTTIPFYRQLDALVLPKDYPCRLSPTGLLNGALRYDG